MSIEADLLLYNYAEVMQRIEDRIAKSTTPIDFPSLFNEIDDGEFAYLCRKDFNGFPKTLQLLPDWAPIEIRQNSTGAFTLHEHILDAVLFWRMVKATYRELNGAPLSSARVLDYGAGWGRVTRLLAKDVSKDRLFASEPNPVFQDLFETCRLPAKLIRTDWESRQDLGVDNIDLLISYSILTHSSEELTHNILDRWAETLKPGGIAAFTIRPGVFLKGSETEMAVFTEVERKGLIDRYKRGEFIYTPYPGDKHWGVTIIPQAYLEKAIKGRFEYVTSRYQFQTWNQLLVFIRRV